MTWYNTFIELNNADGNTSSDVARQTIKDEFEEYFNSTPNRLSGLIDSVAFDFIIQNLKYGENEHDEKLVLTRTTTPIQEGSIVSFDNKDWLAINKENRAVDSHVAYKIQLLNNSISWRDSLNNVYTHKCVLKGKNAFAGFEQTEVTVVDHRLEMKVQKNVQTNLIKLNQRFIFGNRWAYKVVNIDDITMQENKIAIITLERVQVNEDKDDLVNNIAYVELQSSGGTATNGVYFDISSNIINSANLKYLLPQQINVYEYASGSPISSTFTYRIDNIDSSKYEIVSTSANSVTIKGLGYTYNGQLVAIRDGDLQETSIPIKLGSLT